MPLIFIMLVQRNEIQGMCALTNGSGGTWRELREKVEEEGLVRQLGKSRTKKNKKWVLWEHVGGYAVRDGNCSLLHN